jgi:hypothetical protein
MFCMNAPFAGIHSIRFTGDQTQLAGCFSEIDRQPRRTRSRRASFAVASGPWTGSRVNRHDVIWTGSDGYRRPQTAPGCGSTDLTSWHKDVVACSFASAALAASDLTLFQRDTGRSALTARTTKGGRCLRGRPSIMQTLRVQSGLALAPTCRKVTRKELSASFGTTCSSRRLAEWASSGRTNLIAPRWVYAASSRPSNAPEPRSSS